MININSDSGDIHSLQSFNYEEIKTFEFKVQATDSGVPPLSSNVTVNFLSWMRMTTVPGFSRPIPSSVPLTQRTFPILLMRATLWPRSGL